MKTENTGITCFLNKPKNIKIASMSDFFDENENYKKGMLYYIHGFHSNMYEQYWIKESFDIRTILPWLEAGRIWIES
jgi:hypothetical protein